MDRELLDKWCEKGILGLVLAILVYSPLAFGLVRPQEFVIVTWLVVAALLLWTVRFLVSPKHRLLWPPVCWPVLAFAGYAIARYFTAEVEFLARQELIHVLVYAVIFFLTINNLHRKEATQILGLTMVFTAAALSMYAVFQFLAASDYAWHLLKAEGFRKRGSGTFLSPNQLAACLAMLLPLAITFTLTGRVSVMLKIFLGYSCVAIFAGLTATLSHAGWLGGGVSLVVLLALLVRDSDYRKQALIVLGVAVPVFLGLYWMADTPATRHERIVLAERVEAARFQTWGPAAALWKDHLLLGAGPNHFDTRFPQLRSAATTLPSRPERVNNAYLNILAEWGLVGALLVLAGWAALYYQVFTVWKFVQRSKNDLSVKRSNKSTFVLGGALGLLAMLLHSFVDASLLTPANAIVAVTLMALVAAHQRFASERWWTTVRWPLRVPTYLLLAAALVYLSSQNWRRTTETRWLARADAIVTSLQSTNVASNPERRAELNREQLSALEKAAAIEPTNFETAYTLGEVLRQQSLAGTSGGQELAGQATIWFDRAVKLNPYLKLIQNQNGGATSTNAPAPEK